MSSSPESVSAPETITAGSLDHCQDFKLEKLWLPYPRKWVLVLLTANFGAICILFLATSIIEYTVLLIWCAVISCSAALIMNYSFLQSNIIGTRLFVALNDEGQLLIYKNNVLTNLNQLRATLPEDAIEEKRMPELIFALQFGGWFSSKHAQPSGPKPAIRVRTSWWFRYTGYVTLNHFDGDHAITLCILSDSDNNKPCLEYSNLGMAARIVAADKQISSIIAAGLNAINDAKSKPVKEVAS